MSRLVIVGVGGHGRELLDVVEARNRVLPEWEFLGFLDDGQRDSLLLVDHNVTFLGESSQLAALGAAYLIGIGDPDDRNRVDVLGMDAGLESPVMVHPDATLGSRIELGPGSVVTAGARVTTNVQTGRHVHINVNATISHDCRLDDYVIVGPGANLSGNVLVERNVWIGMGSTILQGLRIGEGAVIGAGAVVTRDVLPRTTVVGVPARTRAEDHDR